MVRVMVSQSLVEIEALKTRLEEAGIPCFIKNQHTATLAGEVPFAEVFPELWVTRDEDFSQAKELLSLWKEGESAHGLDWTCGNCGERHGAEYTECWKCGAVRDRPETGKAIVVDDLHQEQQDSVLGPGILIGILVGSALAVGGFSLMHYFNAQRGDVEDRNGDGKIDLVYSYETLSPVAPRYPTSAKTDDNFDGIYDSFYTYDRSGNTTRGEVDRDQDGRPEIIEYFWHGTLSRVEFLDKKTGVVVKRVFYDMSKRVREDIDADGDGTFERTIFFDEYESPQ